eukprot:jgi/Botrbrau1/17862/Bobra.0127s0101.1
MYSLSSQTSNGFLRFHTNFEIKMDYFLAQCHLQTCREDPSTSFRRCSCPLGQSKTSVVFSRLVPKSLFSFARSVYAVMLVIKACRVAAGQAITKQHFVPLWRCRQRAVR